MLGGLLYLDFIHTNITSTVEQLRAWLFSKLAHFVSITLQVIKMLSCFTEEELRLRKAELFAQGKDVVNPDLLMCFPLHHAASTQTIEITEMGIQKNLVGSLHDSFLCRHLFSRILSSDQVSC